MFSGALVVGLGMGAMYLVILGENPFFYLSAEFINSVIMSLSS